MGLFGQAKDMYKLQKKAKQVKKDLKNLHIEVELDGVKVTVSGEQKVVGIEVSPELLNSESKEKLQKALTDSINKAIEKSQEVAAEKMKDVMDQMGINLPGMPGADS